MTAWTTILYALVPHPDQLWVLAQEKSGKISLPKRTHNEDVWISDTQVLKPLLQGLIGAPINILRYVGNQRDEDLSQSSSIHLLELRDESLLERGFWQPIENILKDNDLPPALHGGLVRWQEEHAKGSVAERRAPWALPGWHEKAEAWIADQVARHGRGVIQSIEPVKSWSISCVLKVRAEHGLLYFKAPRDLPLFVNEGVVLTRLAELYPGRIPAPFALSPERGWLLLDDFGEAIGWDAPLEQQAALMSDFARLQIDSTAKIEPLLAAGCKDRRITNLAAHIDPLFDDQLVMSPLTPQERTKLKQFAPKLKALIAELMALPIPAALLHGDLHGGNVTMRDGSFLYFDWTDAAVSHPFFDMLHIYREEDETKRATLQGAYLSIWKEHYPEAAVQRAWELAGVLFRVYHAVSYQYIANGIEELVQPELNFAFYFLRKLLASQETGDVH